MKCTSLEDDLILVCGSMTELLLKSICLISIVKRGWIVPCQKYDPVSRLHWGND